MLQTCAAEAGATRGGSPGEGAWPDHQEAQRSLGPRGDGHAAVEGNLSLSVQEAIL